MSTEHTPGPWITSYDGSINTDAGTFICGFRWDSYKEFTEGNNSANARLIAAAPDMLEALEDARQLVVNILEIPETDDVVIGIDDAIAKARGTS